MPPTLSDRAGAPTAEGRGSGAPPGFDGLHARLLTELSQGLVSWPDDRFADLALEIFRWQYSANPVYQRFAEGRGVTPDSVTRWEDIPAVPVRAFKRLPLVTGDPEKVERVFRTSGTTERSRGEHRVPRLDLYRASLLPSFRAHLLPDDAALRFISLIPSPHAQPDSSLSTMVGEAMEAFGVARSGWFVRSAPGLSEGHALDLTGLEVALRAAEEERQPILFLGTAFAFVHWLDALGAAEGGRPHFRLPAGSRLLETGGFKGRARVMPRDELYAALERRLGLAPEWMVNEYGMTELLSQYYEPTLGQKSAAGSLSEALEARRFVPPPWLRYRVLDPVTLAPLPNGQSGVLAHYDLANAGSVMAVLTEDFGYRDERGLKLIGRTPGAEPRGCSLAMDELLAAAARV
jgi:hypothetical protein